MLLNYHAMNYPMTVYGNDWKTHASYPLFIIDFVHAWLNTLDNGIHSTDF